MGEIKGPSPTIAEHAVAHDGGAHPLLPFAYGGLDGFVDQLLALLGRLEDCFFGELAGQLDRGDVVDACVFGALGEIALALRHVLFRHVEHDSGSFSVNITLPWK